MTLFDQQWVYYLPISILFLVGLLMVVFARIKHKRDEWSQINGLIVMFMALTLAISVHGEFQKTTKAVTDQTQKEKVEKTESNRRLGLIADELGVSESNVIVYEAEQGLLKAVTNRGSYLVEFDDPYETILKIIKIQN
ncbi:hypothetical protein [Metabacillus sp. SLBN-84]